MEALVREETDHVWRGASPHAAAAHP
jgi:hypothetical protein